MASDLVFDSSAACTASDPARRCALLQGTWQYVGNVKVSDMQGVVRAEQSSGSGQATARTEKQADEEATRIKEEAEAAGEGAEVEKQGNELRVTKAGGEQIYIGFEKGDKDRSGSGRIIEDDPSRYPDRTQTTGGWSGGEKGLAAFIEVCFHELDMFLHSSHQELCSFEGAHAHLHALHIFQHVKHIWPIHLAGGTEKSVCQECCCA